MNFVFKHGLCACHMVLEDEKTWTGNTRFLLKYNK